MTIFKVITIAAAVIAVALAAIAAYAATRPGQMEVRRSTSIKASADKIFPLINDLHVMNSWNPFDKMDPSTKGSYSGPAAGRGAHYDFESAKAGSGSLEIVDTSPSSRVVMRLLMTRPLAADNRVTFTLTPEGGATRVTWAMEGESPFLAKVLHLFVNVDKMVGGSFEAGLADLKGLAERSASPTS
jgi:uncharacterized protein YndB with AHSA1/START domain